MKVYGFSEEKLCTFLLYLYTGIKYIKPGSGCWAQLLNIRRRKRGVHVFLCRLLRQLYCKMDLNQKLKLVKSARKVRTVAKKEGYTEKLF